MLYAQPDVDPRKFSNRLSNLGIHQTKMDYHLPFPQLDLPIGLNIRIFNVVKASYFCKTVIA
jgi:hypothetical protein